MSVHLAEPDGPITAVSFPPVDVDRDAAQRVDRRVALAVAASDLVRRNDRRRLCVYHPSSSSSGTSGQPARAGPNTQYG